MSLFNINKVICINVKALDQRSAFIVSREFSIDYESLLTYMKQSVSRLWVCQEIGMTIAFERVYVNMHTGELSDKKFEFFKEVCPVTKKEWDRVFKMKPLLGTKIKKDEDTLNHYLYYLDKGYDIRMPSLDRKIEHIRKTNGDKQEDKQEDYIEEKEDNVYQSKVVKQNKTKKSVSLEIDEILDKINENGIESLTKEEKEFLDNLYS